MRDLPVCFHVRRFWLRLFRRPVCYALGLFGKRILVAAGQEVDGHASGFADFCFQRGQLLCGFKVGDGFLRLRQFGRGIVFGLGKVIEFGFQGAVGVGGGLVVLRPLFPFARFGFPVDGLLLFLGCHVFWRWRCLVFCVNHVCNLPAPCGAVVGTVRCRHSLTVPESDRGWLPFSHHLLWALSRLL